MRRLLAGVTMLFLVLVLACNQKVVNPVTPGYPCGTQGLVCPNHMCCWLGDVCGGDVPPTCPVNMCCWVGPDDPGNLGVSLDKKKPRPQFAPTN
jgi:hypothetical protein